MNARRYFALAAAVAALASCNTYRVAGAVTFGRVHDVSEADIQGAIVAFHHGEYRDVAVGQIEVVSRDEIHIYWSAKSSCCLSILKRQQGRWVHITDEIRRKEV